MNLLLVDDHRLFRDGLAMLLEKLDSEVSILQAGTGQQALDLINNSDLQLDLDLAIIDYQLPDTTGIHLLQSIKQKLPATPVVIMSGLEDPEVIRATLAQGASGFLPKTLEPWEIIDALHLVMDGAFYVPPFILNRMDNSNKSDEYSDLTSLAAKARQIIEENDWNTPQQKRPSRAIDSINTALNSMLSERRELQRQAFHDDLTGLPNRRLFTDRLNQTLKQAKRNKSLFALLALDLDKFKHINDTLGHPAGDQLLAIIAERMRQSLRSVDTAARLGGDEFMVILNDVTDLSNAQMVIERLHSNLCSPCKLGAVDITPSVSLGATIGFGGDDATQLLAQADKVLYKVKASGRNNYQIFTKE